MEGFLTPFGTKMGGEGIIVYKALFLPWMA